MRAAELLEKLKLARLFHQWSEYIVQQKLKHFESSVHSPRCDSSETSNFITRLRQCSTYFNIALVEIIRSCLPKLINSILLLSMKVYETYWNCKYSLLYTAFIWDIVTALWILILLMKMENGRQWIGIYFTSLVVFQSRLPIRMKRRYDANNMQLTWSTLKRKSIGWLI